MREKSFLNSFSPYYSILFAKRRDLDVVCFVTVYLLVLVVKVNFCKPRGAAMASSKAKSQTTTTQSGSGL